MANKQQAKKMAAKGKSAAQIKAKTGVGNQTANKLITKNAPTPKAQAPKAPTQPAAPVYRNSAGDVVQNQYPGQLSAYDQRNIDNLRRQIGRDPTWVPGLMEPGMAGYNAKTGGGNFVWSPGGTVDPEQLRAAYRDSSVGWDRALDGKNRADYTLDALYSVDQAPAQQTASSSAKGKTKGKGEETKELKIKGLNQGLRVAGKNGISKGEFKTIAGAKGKDPEKIVAKLDKINTKLGDKDKAGINLKSGAANMLIKKAQKSSDKYRGYRTPDFGEGPIGSTLQSMISTPANAGTWIKGQLTGGREADPGFNPGGKADKNRMVGGQVIRPSGKIADKGVGEQYKLPKRFKGEEDVGDTGGGKRGGGKDGGGNTGTEPIDTNPTGGDTPIQPTAPVEEVDRSASSGAGGLDLASWATSFKRARSSRQRAGRNAQGLASQKKNPFKSWT
jgi:hypothetical protein